MYPWSIFETCSITNNTVYSPQRVFPRYATAIHDHLRVQSLQEQQIKFEYQAGMLGLDLAPPAENKTRRRDMLPTHDMSKDQRRLNEL